MGTLKELEGLSISLDQRISHVLSKGLEFTETTFLVFGFEFCKNTFVISRPGSDEVIKDAREFVRSVFNGDGSAEACALRSVEIAEIGFAVVKALGT